MKGYFRKPLMSPGVVNPFNDVENPFDDVVNPFDDNLSQIGGSFLGTDTSEGKSSVLEDEKQSISDWTINPDNNPHYIAIMKKLLFLLSVPVFALCTTLLPKLIESNDTLEQLKTDEDWLVPLASWLVMNGIVAAGQSIGSYCQIMPFKEQTILKAMSTYFFVFGSFIAASTLATISSPFSEELNNVLLSSLSGCTAALFAQFFLLTCNNQSPLISCAPQFKINHEAAALLPVLIAFIGPDIFFSAFEKIKLSSDADMQKESILAIKVSLAILIEVGCAAELVKKSRQEPGLLEDFHSRLESIGSSFLSDFSVHSSQFSVDSQGEEPRGDDSIYHYHQPPSGV